MSKATRPTDPFTSHQAEAAWRRKVLAAGMHESYSYNSRSRNNLMRGNQKPVKMKADFSDVRGGSSTSAPVRPKPKKKPPVPEVKKQIESISQAMKRIRGG